MSRGKRLQAAEAAAVRPSVPFPSSLASPCYRPLLALLAVDEIGARPERGVQKMRVVGPWLVLALLGWSLCSGLNAREPQTEGKPETKSYEEVKAGRADACASCLTRGGEGECQPNMA